MNKFFFSVIFFFLFSSITLTAQTISVDDTSRNKEELVNLLIGNDCINTSNISLSSIKSVAYFENNSGDFPIPEGIIIRNGIAKYSEGLYTGEDLSSEISTNGDAQLQEISDNDNQNADITDVAFLEFDFIPLATDFSFNFLFASNEYGNSQCDFSDVFAIILTDIDTGSSQNLAVTKTNVNVSVKNIRDKQYNISCESAEPELFSTYNVNNASNSTLNMNGHTVTLNASAIVTPNKSYKIKFLIGDYYDYKFDSAVFIEAGSFEANINLGEDQNICSGNEITLDSGFTNTTDFTYTWKKDGTVIIGETNPTLIVTEIGTYDINVENLASNCNTLKDQIIISDLQVNTPSDLYECYTTDRAIFNLTLIDQIALGIDPDVYDVFYYNSSDNATNNVPINDGVIESYSSLGNEKIYIKLKDRNTNNFCGLVLNFDLIIVDEVEATTPDDIKVCEADSSVNLSEEVGAQIMNGLNASNHTIKYFTSSNDATNNSNEIPNPTAFPLPNNTNTINIWARLINTTNNKNCFDIVSFQIIFSDLPLVDELEDVYECTEYVLPTLSNGNYFTGPGGSGTQLSAGDVITDDTQIYIYNENVDGCSNENSFLILIAINFSIELEHCEKFIIPSYPNAEFYTESNGPNGTGTIIPTGTIIETSQTIYFYVEIDDVFCLENEYEIVINSLPSVDIFDDVITCDSYTLPSISNGDFFTLPNGSGTQLNSGDEITTSKTIYIYNIDDTTTCDNSSSFNITIIDTNQFEEVTNCGDYSIPLTTIGNYYTETNGGGTIIPENTLITTSQTIFYYASEVTTSPNCTTNIEIDITINPLPEVDDLDDISRCINNLPTLDPLVNGKYYSESGGNIDLNNEILAGTEITTSQRIYIHNTNTNCEAQTDFYVDIRPIPLIDNISPGFSCGLFFELPRLTNGQYFTGPGRSGEQLFPGHKITSSTTLYIHNQDIIVNSCDNQVTYDVYVWGVVVDQLADVIACESYELQPLTVGNYFTEIGGGGTPLFAGDIIETTQQIFIYADNDQRRLCKNDPDDPSDFTITVYHRPILDKFENMEACGSITLPTSPLPNTKIDYYRDINYTDLIDPSEHTITKPGIQNIYSRAYPTGNPDCYVDDNFQIRVYPLLDLDIEGGIICIDSETDETTNPFLLESHLDPNEFTVQWFLNDVLVGTGPEYSATKAGTYRVQTIKLMPEIGPNCNYNPTEVVVEASRPEFEVFFLTEDFVDVYSLEVKALNIGLGNYVYSLDGGSFQRDNKFYNINPGNYTITIKDLSGICPDSTLDFIALEHPKFFTPNEDGVNDTWNILDLKNDLSATIKIFSRHGRLLEIIKPSGNGWGGNNNNGRKEQSTDYWFLVDYAKKGGRAEYRGNFSMIRR